MTDRLPVPPRPAETYPVAFSLQHADPLVWASTLEQLAADGSPSALHTLEQLAVRATPQAGDALVSVRAALILLTHTTLPSLTLLRWCLVHGEDAIREAAAARVRDALQQGVVHGQDTLVSAMATDPSARVRYESVGLLSYVSDQGVRAQHVDSLRVDPIAALAVVVHDDDRRVLLG